MANMKKSGPKMPSPKRPGSKPVPMPTRAPNTTGSKTPRRAPNSVYAEALREKREISNARAKKIGSKTITKAPRQTPSKPLVPKKGPGKMTPQDAAMKKILEKRYGKIYG
jgi:hypothetical protein